MHLEIYAYLRRRVDTETARDAAAETFLTVWRRLDDVPDGDGTRPWVYGVARKSLANQRRSQRRFGGLRKHLAQQADETPRSPNPETVVVRQADMQEVLDAVGRLGPADQEVLRLAAWEELSHEQIGVVLGCSPHAVDQRLLRAKRRLEHEVHSHRRMEHVKGIVAGTERGDVR